MMKYEVPIWEKSNLTLEEAAVYSGIGQAKLRELSNDENCSFEYSGLRVPPIRNGIPTKRRMIPTSFLHAIRRNVLSVRK